MATEDSHREAYLFGDSDLAARRLKLLASVFAPSTRDLLSRFVPQAPRKIADLGCGPGYTTRLLADIFQHAQVLGVDSSPAFIELACGEQQQPRIGFALADVTSSLPEGPFDLIYCRYLITHLARPREAISLWAENLSDHGSIAIEENESIHSNVPAFVQYLSIVEAMLASQGQQLYIGRELDALGDGTRLVKRASEIKPVAVDPRDAARMFVMNIVGWRKQPFVTARHSESELDALQDELGRLATAEVAGGSITFGHRRLVLGKLPRAVTEPANL